MRRMLLIVSMAAAWLACASNTGGSSEEPPVCPEECVDDDPCTIDSCHEDLCVFVPSGNCMRMDCNSHQVTAAEELTADDFLSEGPREVKLAVHVDVGPPQGCTEADCPESRPCCNTCDGDVALVSDGVPLDLAVVGQAAWSCVVDSCGLDGACDPVVLGAAYWIWGEIQPSGRGEVAPVFQVEDWCMQPTPESLAGRWEGRFESGSIPAQDWALDIAAPEGVWQMSISTTQVESGLGPGGIVLPEQTLTNVYVEETTVGFDFLWCEDWGQRQPCQEEWEQITGHMDLRTGRDSLSGTVFPFGSGVWEGGTVSDARDPAFPAERDLAPMPFGDTPIQFLRP